MKIIKALVCTLIVSCIFSLTCHNKEANASDPHHCSNCGKPISWDYIFCPYCSKAVYSMQIDECWNENHSEAAPVDLTSIAPYYSGYIDAFTDGATDIMGNYYNTGIYGIMSKSDNVNCFNLWNIGGKFNRLTATGIILEEDKGSGYKAACRIYGDGVLLYERSEIDSMTKPYHIEIDITGVNDLKIELFGKVDMLDSISAVLADVMLH